MATTVAAMCGAAEERVVRTHKAPGACPRCGGAVVATDVESERRILCLPLCVKSKRKYSCSRHGGIRIFNKSRNVTPAGTENTALATPAVSERHIDMAKLRRSAQVARVSFRL